MSHLTCSICHGEGGGRDYFGEWDDCWLCGGDGIASSDQEISFYRWIKETDDRIEREMLAEAGREPEQAREAMRVGA